MSSTAWEIPSADIHCLHIFFFLWPLSDLIPAPSPHLPALLYLRMEADLQLWHGWLWAQGVKPPALALLSRALFALLSTAATFAFWRTAAVATAAVAEAATASAATADAITPAKGCFCSCHQLLLLYRGWCLCRRLLLLLTAAAPMAAAPADGWCYSGGCSCWRLLLLWMLLLLRATAPMAAAPAYCCSSYGCCSYGCCSDSRPGWFRSRRIF